MMKPIPVQLQFFHVVQVVEQHARVGGRGPNAVKSQNITEPKNSNEPTRNRGLPPTLHGRNSQDEGATSPVTPCVCGGGAQRHAVRAGYSKWEHYC